MKIKVDTKEKFIVLRLTGPLFSVKMAEDLAHIVRERMKGSVKNVIIDFSDTKEAAEQALMKMAGLHQLSYKNHASFVLCGIHSDVQFLLEKLNLWESLNITPTESEAWDMVQMEEMERDMFGDK